MKKIIFILSLFLAGSAFADSTNIARLRAVGLSPEQTREIDAIYNSGRTAGESVSEPVFILTPVAATNQLVAGVNVVPPTATAATQAFIGPVVPVVGQRFIVHNGSASTVAIAAQAQMKINDTGAAGEKLPLTTKTTGECITTRGIGYNATLTPTPGSYTCRTFAAATPTP